MHVYMNADRLCTMTQSTYTCIVGHKVHVHVHVYVSSSLIICYVQSSTLTCIPITCSRVSGSLASRAAEWIRSCNSLIPSFETEDTMQILRERERERERERNNGQIQYM